MRGRAGLAVTSEDDVQEPAGLAVVLEENRVALLGFLTARCGARDVAEDLLQDLWIKVNSQPSGPVASPRSYLFRMANNLVLDRARGMQRAMRRDRVWVEAEQGPATALPEHQPDLSDPADEVLARKQEAQALHDAIAGLPAGAARALRLYRFEELGQTEIAQVMGISRSGVEKHLALAMKRLRAALADCGKFDAAASFTQGADGGETAHRKQGQ